MTTLASLTARGAAFVHDGRRLILAPATLNDLARRDEDHPHAAFEAMLFARLARGNPALTEAQIARIVLDRPPEAWIPLCREADGIVPDETRAARVDWAALFRALARRYGFTPAQVGEMTLAQLRAYLQPAPEVLSPEAIARRLARRRDHGRRRHARSGKESGARREPPPRRTEIAEEKR